MTDYEFAGKLAKDTGLEVEHVDKILTEFTNVLNDTFLSDTNYLKTLLAFIKKKQGLSMIIEETQKRSEMPEEEVKTVVNYMMGQLKQALKSGGIKRVMTIIKTIKKQTKALNDSSADDSEQHDSEPEEIY